MPLLKMLSLSQSHNRSVLTLELCSNQGRIFRLIQAHYLGICEIALHLSIEFISCFCFVKTLWQSIHPIMYSLQTCFAINKLISALYKHWQTVFVMYPIKLGNWFLNKKLNRFVTILLQNVLKVYVYKHNNIVDKTPYRSTLLIASKWFKNNHIPS